MNKRILLLLLVVLIAGFLRFWQLGTNPPSLTWDEAAWGYNAYSIGIDGRDEFGRFLPHDYLESFGDFKPPLYAYLTVIPVKLFGLNEFTTRFPSAILGTLTVLVTYFLVKELFGKKDSSLPLLSALFLAISPWHINLSRAAFEANAATFFLASGVWLFLAGIQGKRWGILLSTISFALSLYIFNTPRVVAPILAILLIIGFRRELWERRKQAIVAFVVGVLLIAPLIQFLSTPQARLRFQEVNIFSDIEVIKRTNQQIENDNNAWWSQIIHNRRFAFAGEYLRHYLDNLSPDFLFIRGDGNPKFSTRDVGQLFLWEFPFLVAGLLFLFKKREKNWWIIPLWLIVGIAPAATARETPHALRIETVLPTFQIIVAYGFYQFFSWIKNFRQNIKKVFFFVFGILIIVNLIYYLHGYYTYYPREYSGEWQYGYKESIDYAKSVESSYDAVLFTTILGRPYVYYLFYTQTPPDEFRKQSVVKRDVFGFVTVESIGKYYFGSDPAMIKKNGTILYINEPSRVPQGANILKTFFLLNGSPVLVAYTL